MAALTHAESRRLYSWWWDSHISPKNSKWLQENLSDMDAKVKLMIKLLEEDADSFARRAEMYYKKRPELMKLVEEFYRAYRALAERYDHATGALRQAHRTIAEAFPNQIPFALIDDSPSSSSTVEGEPHTPEMPAPIRAFIEPDDLQKDALSQSAHFHSRKRNGAYSEESDALNSRRGLKQLNEMFASGEATIHPKFTEGKTRKGQIFHEEEGKVPEHKINDVSRDIQEKEVGNEEDAYEKTRSLQDEVSQLSTEDRNLETQIKSEVENVDKFESEIHRLQASLSRVEAEKEATLLRYHESMEKMSNLDMETSHAQADNRKLKSEMLITLARLESVEGRCSQLETEKQALEMEVKVLARQTDQQQCELLQKQDEMEKLKCSAQEENIRHTQATAALQSSEKLHSESLEKLRISTLEMENQVEQLRAMELRKHKLEEDIQQVNRDNSSLKKKIKVAQEELEKLNITIQNEHLLSAQAEEALQSLQKLHSQSQEEIKILMSDLQSKVERLKDMELKKQTLEEEIQQLNERSESLNNQVLSSTLMIKDLQLEILSLKETRLKLENEVEHHLHENKALQQEVHYLKEGIANLDLEHQFVMEQIKAVGLNKESFQASVKDLQDRSLELRVLCKRWEDENAILLQKLENMEKVTEKNTLLETSLSDATVELEGLKEKVKTLEESSESLNCKISDLTMENRSLVLQLEITSKNMEKLSEDNAFLGNSLSEANVELEGSRGRLKCLEESSQYLLNENSNLQSEKHTLIFQVENIGNSLENMKRSYAELEDKNFNLEQEKESTLMLLSELQNLLKLEKQEHEAFILSSSNRVATLTDMINLLQEEGQVRDEVLESVQHKLLDSQIKAFVLQRCLLDAKENNSQLVREYQKHVGASRLAGSLRSQLETENLRQTKVIASISEHNKKLREAIQMVLNSLGIKSACMLGGTAHEADCPHILDQTKEIQSFISDLLDENHILLVEKSVNITLLQQLGLDLTVLSSEKNALTLWCRTTAEQLLALKSENNDLLQTNEQLRQDILASYLREDSLKAETDTLSKQLLDLIEGRKKLQCENCNLVEEKQSLEKNVLNLRIEVQELEDENNAFLAEVTALSLLSLILETFGAERTMDLRVCSTDLGSLRDVNNDLKEKLAQVIQKVEVIEAENMFLKDSAYKLEDCQGQLFIVQDDLNMARNVHEQLKHQIEQLSQQIETGRSLLVQKDLELAEVNQKCKVTENENMKLFRDLGGMNMKFDEAMHVKDELEKRICKLTEGNSRKDNEISNICEANQMLTTDINTLSKELAVVRAHKEQFTLELTDGIKRYEEEVARLWNDVHFSGLQVGIFEEKVLELMVECESLEIIAMVQRKVLEEQIILSNAYVDELMQKFEPLESESEKLKAQLNAHLPLVLSLQSSTASLEHRILSLVKHQGLENDSSHDSSLVRLEHEKGHRQFCEDPCDTVTDGIPMLQNLQVKVEELHKVLVEHWDILVLENPDVSARPPAMKVDIEVLTPGKNLGKEEVQENRCTTMELEEDVQESGKYLELQDGGTESSKGTYGLTMKDIQLDHASCDAEICRVENSRNDNQMLELWETAERDFNNQVLKAPSVTTGDGVDRHQTEAVEEEKTQCPYKIAAEKEVGVDKLVVPRRVKDSHLDWNKKILECLVSDAHRLSSLQKSMQELKRMLENSEKTAPSTNMKYDSVRWQLRETEEAISKLFDTNSRLTKKAEDCCASSDKSIGEEDEVRNKRKRQVSERARRGSEKIGRLELELQRIQYIILKLDEEHEHRTKAAHRKVILRDYLYGRRESYKRKKGHFCGCIQSKTGND